MSAVVVLVRKGTTGKFLDALRGSETAAASVGINGSRQRVVAFALSAGIAGLGGGLLAMLDTQANYAANYAPFFGLVWLVLVVTVGVRTVDGAVVAGLALVLFPELLKELGISLEWQYVLFGLGALVYARHPEGILEAQKRQVVAFVQRHGRHRDRPTASPGGPGAAMTVAATSPTDQARP